MFVKPAQVEGVAMAARTFKKPKERLLQKETVRVFLHSARSLGSDKEIRNLYFFSDGSGHADTSPPTLTKATRGVRDMRTSNRDLVLKVSKGWMTRWEIHLPSITGEGGRA